MEPGRFDARSAGFVLSVLWSAAAQREPTLVVERSGCLRRLVVALITAAALATPALFPATSSGDAASLQGRVDQARSQAGTLAASVQLRTAELAAASAQAAAAGRRQVVLQAALVRGRERLAQLRARAAAAHRRLVVAQARYRRSQQLLARRLVAIYKSGSPDMATVLLESDGFADLLTRAGYLKRINEADSTLVRRVEALRNFVREVLERVRALRDQAASQVARIADARAEVARIGAAAEARAAALQRARAAQQASLVALRSRIAGWTEQVRALQAAGGGGGGAGQTVAGWLGEYSIPTSIVMCESGGNYGAVNPKSGAGGAYQFLPETYRGLGGRYDGPHVAPKWEQDQLAAKLWRGGSGAGNWECAK